MVTWLDYLVEKERRREERARAEVERRSDHTSRTEEAKLHSRSRRREKGLVALGHRLVALRDRNR